VLIVADGCANQLCPLSVTQLNPLLPVVVKPMIDYVMYNLAHI
jgi:dTDP-glucose pyrophosphorylase